MSKKHVKNDFFFGGIWILEYFCFNSNYTLEKILTN